MSIVTKKSLFLAWLPALLIAAGAIVAFVRVQTHAEDPAKHLTRETLQEEYVPRTEVDHRFEAQMELLRSIDQNVRDLK